MPDTTAAPVVVTAPQNLDIYTIGDYRIKLRAPAGRTSLIVADLTNTEYMDSSGLGVLVGGLQHARAHGCAFGVACASEQLLRIFRISGLTTVLDIRPTTEAFETAATAGED
jgi:anti-sigma B factor antagonist